MEKIKNYGERPSGKPDEKVEGRLLKWKGTELHEFHELIMSHRSSQIAQILFPQIILDLTDRCSINAAFAQRKSVR